MQRNTTLEDIIDTPVFKNDTVLLDLLRQAEEISHGLLYIANFTTRRFEFMSPTCLEKMKYPVEFFLRGGADSLYHLAEPETKLTLAEQQAVYLAELKQNYDPEQINILEFQGTLRKGDGVACTFLCLSLLLTYGRDGDVDWSIILLLVEDLASQPFIDHCKALLARIKLRHNEIYRHAIPSGEKKSLPVVHISTKRIDLLLSRREEETLKYLAQGLTTKEISVAMSITNNTVETYRKNLLTKFEAKNIAELIKKASKIYWLD